MDHIRIRGGSFEAQCRRCGAWRQVSPRQTGSDAFFVHWQAEFTCCGTPQDVRFTQEKDEIDIH